MGREELFMFGLLVWKTPQQGKREKTVVLSERSVLRARFLQGEILRGPRTPEAVWRRRVIQATKGLRKRGVTRVVPPADLEGGINWEKYGLRPVSTLPLRRRLAADWTGTLLAAQGLSQAGAKIALSAAQMTGELVRTVTELSLRYRYVLLDVPYGGEELCRQLRREYGVSLLLGPNREQMESAGALVLFDARADLRRRNPVVLPVYDETAPMPPLYLPPALEDQLPEGADRGRLLAALLEIGALRPGQAAVGQPTLDIPPCKHYNTTS